jgi:hypothetical protein
VAEQGPKNFLVRIGEVMFFVHFDAKLKPFGVPTPSTSQHMTYAKADAVCQHLIELGYNACVCDIFGVPAELETILRERAPRAQD